MFKRPDAPSNPSASDRWLGIALSTEGYIVALPDYLGLGTNSPALHPYVHARSEAVACVDMLRAALARLTNGLAIRTNGQVFLVGYSQGGHATLALQRELEQRHAGEFTVTASAPMAGPHDLSGTMKALLLTDIPYSSPSYLAYLLFGQNAVYGLFRSPSEILKPPYDTTLPPLLDGAHSGSEIDANMPSVPKSILKDEFLADFSTNTNNAFCVALRANDTYRWTPSAPTRLYHCAGDTVVPRANSEAAYAEFALRGATNVSLLDPLPSADHAEGALPCFLAAKAWFDTLRTP
jgi:pimeloyl-ACP methyl ester carboxylesterase